jgi:hypothetical protein
MFMMKKYFDGSVVFVVSTDTFGTDSGFFKSVRNDMGQNRQAALKRSRTHRLFGYAAPMLIRR